jgi:hypothetical protein
VAQNETLHRQLVEISDAMLAEIRKWASDDWIKKCELHGDTSDARRLVLHIATRSRRVTGAMREQSRGRLATSPHHPATQLEPIGVQEAMGALTAARDEALDAIQRLDDEDIQLLHESEIDGERDVLMASCGLIGHWTFHLPVVQQIRLR